MNTFQEIKDRIDKSSYIIVTAHVNPDGDAIGAGLALTLALKKIGKKARFVLQDLNPQTTNFLEGIENVEQYSLAENYQNDLTICVDCAAEGRLGSTKALLVGRDSINIDHHISNNSYGTYNYVIDASSTSEIIFSLLKFCNIEIDKAIGEALYTGLVNDTGNFKHDNVKESTFLMAAELKRIGVDNCKIIREFWDTRSFAAIRLVGKAMYEMRFDNEKKLAYYFMSKDVLDKYNGRKEDTEGIVENLLSLREANVSLFLREDKIGFIKGSMRSKNDTDVNEIAALFGGGGHKKAAGFSSTLPGEEIIRIVLEKL